MNGPTSSPPSGRCGMCGSCGTMPPWAPERLKNTSPEARLALERRMREAQKRFIEQRDAKRALLPNPSQDASPLERQEKPPATPVSPTENHIQMTATSYEDLPNSDSPVHKEDFIHDPLQNERHTLQLAAARSCELLDQQLLKPDIRNEFTTKPQLEIEDAEKTASLNITPLECGDDIEDHANVEIPLHSVETPSQPANNNSSHEKNTINPDFEASRVPQPPRRKQPRFASPVILESPASPATTELDMLPEISLEPDQLSEPLRTISLRDRDSDADSFHTAEGEEALRRSTESLPLKDAQESEKDIAPVVSEIEWQAFQEGDHDTEPEVASKVSESVGSVSAISSTDEDASLEGFTKDMGTSAQLVSEAENLGSQSNNPKNSTATTGSSPKVTRDALVDDYALSADLVQPSETTLDPKRCEDCERWRGRVQELEFKVEALTSALTAREMESASMRARVADRRHAGKNAAQLMEECESLRMTTEYLYHKLERYERKLNGSHPVIH